MGHRDIQDFWLHFAERYWEQGEVLLDQAQMTAMPQVSADELLGAVIGCVDDFWRGGRQKVRLYVNDEEVDLRAGAYRQFLPSKRDASFEDYNTRMLEQEGLNNYALVVADWHQFDRALWERILGAVQQLGAVVGLSRARMDTQVFLGTYKTTPFGVHIDQTSGFHFPVVGRKTMRFWPDAFAERTPALRGAMEYSRFVDASTSLTAVPGQAMYWPSHDWHVAESDGRFSVTWGFGYWLGDRMTRSVVDELMHLLLEKPIPHTVRSAPELAAEARAMGEVDALLEKVARAARDPRFRNALVHHWLQHFSAGGYLRVPSMTDAAELAPDDRVARKPMYNILATQDPDGSVHIAAGGYSTTISGSPSVWSALGLLNSGGALPAGSADGGIGPMIEFLMRAGALYLVPRASCGTD